MRVLLATMLSISLVAIAAPAMADPLCTPFHAYCTSNPISGQHADAGAFGVGAHVGDYSSSSWGDCAHGNCYRGTALEVFGPSNTQVEYRVGADGYYPYTLADAYVAGQQVASYYHNDGGDPVYGFECIGVAGAYFYCGYGLP